IEIAGEPNAGVRKKLLLKIRNIGNHRHNCQVLREGRGVLIVGYRPIASYGYYVRTDLWRCVCPLKPAPTPQTDSTGKRARVGVRVAHKSDLLKPPPVGVSFQLHQVLSPMKRDDVALVVKNDTLIVELAKHEYMKLGHDVDQHGYIRNRVRELGRLVIQLRKNTQQPNASLESFVHPHHLSDIVKAVHDIAGYDVPSLALKISYSVKKCALVLKGSELESGQKHKAERVEEFLQLCELNWQDLVSTHAHKTLYQGKRNKVTILPTYADVVHLSSFLHEADNRELQLLQGARSKEIRPA
ncbi:LOW QUALITY PROTEIN: uncharacterized protein LOC110988285, partial [Acanthaster planci]|uniref:LOW QUALITY PROTEIN: uncharacterized protein LOC110988285 n=1 Tax=Acanthaster planci TaxID=133434 RepID=A0A8B7ZP22_ACAPL